MSAKRNFGLDLLRATAITGVFIGHSVGKFARLTTFLDLFFCLSGFLIGRVYFQSRHNDSFRLGKFWLSRWWRTLPPYYAALALFAISPAWAPLNAHVSWHYLFFLQNFTWEPAFFPSWSLCVEEHFYLGLPLLALSAERLVGRHSLLWLFPLLFLVPSLLLYWMIQRLGGIDHVPVPWHPLKYTPFSTQPLLAGVWMSYLYVERPDLFRYVKKIALPVSIILLPIIFYLPGSGGPTWLVANYSAIKAIGFVALLRMTYDLHWEPHNLIGHWTKSLVRATAITSYSIYLMHTLFEGPILRYTQDWHRSFGKSALIVACMFVPCIPFYYLFEKPSILTRDRYLLRQARPGPMTV